MTITKCLPVKDCKEKYELNKEINERRKKIPCKTSRKKNAKSGKKNLPDGIKTRHWKRKDQWIWRYSMRNYPYEIEKILAGSVMCEKILSK